MNMTPNIGNIVGAIAAPIVETQEEAELLYSRLSNKGNIEERAKGYDDINREANDVIDAIHGKPVSEVAKAYGESVAVSHKSHDSLWNPTQIRAYTFNQLSTALDVDMQWMQFFQMIDSRNATEVDMATITSLVEFAEYKDGEKIKVGPLANLSAERFRGSRYGVGVSVLNYWMKHNGVLTMNQIIQRIMVAELKKRASLAYTELADTAGVSVEAFATNIETTLNNAANNMIDALLANSSAYDVTDQSPFLLLTNSVNKPAVNARLNVVRGQDGTNQIPEYNIVPVYVRNTNVAADLGLGGANRGMLILPGVANAWADFEALKMGNQEEISSDSIDVFAQFRVGLQAKAIQKRVITLA